MKVYLYDPETGCYQGEDFTDAPLLSDSPAATSCSTTVAPPPYAPGVVPVFKHTKQRWELESVWTLKTRT
ncbi:hypothetical protein [Geomonas ferrireducens]|uniref:hypothetical protein n=1 Tax=Geomonas ferrireducens TaxID=2570227 RepID=UPI0010A760E0|nr:hypothetical protein [Geomonas ferrireducens]